MRMHGFLKNGTEKKEKTNKQTTRIPFDYYELTLSSTTI